MLNRSQLKTTYSIGFLFALHGALLVYINSSFAAQAIGENAVSILYTVASIVSILLLIALPRLLRRFGNYHTTLTFLLIELVAVIGLAVAHLPVLLILFFVAHNVLIRAVSFDIDIFLESSSSDGATGGIRGIFFTFINAAFVLSPLIVGLILGNTTRYERLYALASLITIPVLIILMMRLRKYRDSKYERVSLLRTIRELSVYANVRRIMIAQAALRFFYAVMVIYSPIYLHNHLGFSWGAIGTIFTIMLLPFVLLELPLGKIADRWLGEKEILVLGLLTLAGATGVLSFITAPSIALWATALFMTRVGASMIDIMSETYFFKIIDETDTHLIGFFRILDPFAYTIGPIFAGLIIYFVDIKYLFVILGAVILLAIPSTLRLQDTK